MIPLNERKQNKLANKSTINDMTVVLNHSTSNNMKAGVHEIIYHLQFVNQTYLF